MTGDGWYPCPNCDGAGGWNYPVPTDPTPPVEALRRVLTEHGIASVENQGLHGWRCRYPERYGPCDCFDELVRDLAALTPAQPVADRICPDCGLTARRIGDIHINAQEAAQPVTETTDRARIVAILNDSGSYESMEAVADAVLAVTETTDLRAAAQDALDCMEEAWPERPATQRLRAALTPTRR